MRWSYSAQHQCRFLRRSVVSCHRLLVHCVTGWNSYDDAVKEDRACWRGVVGCIYFLFKAVWGVCDCLQTELNVLKAEAVRCCHGSSCSKPWQCGVRARTKLDDRAFSVAEALTPSTPAVPNCCCSKGPAPYWSNPSFLIFDIWALWRSGLSARAPKCQKLKMTG